MSALFIIGMAETLLNRTVEEDAAGPAFDDL